jgi:hypothetical protein
MHTAYGHDKAVYKITAKFIDKPKTIIYDADAKMSCPEVFVPRKSIFKKEANMLILKNGRGRRIL